MAEASLHRLLRVITPPALRRLLRVGRPARDGGSRAGGAPFLHSVPPIGPKALNYVIGEAVLSVPMLRVRYPDGRPYTYEDHHFMQYYRHGLSALRAFYDGHQPNNVFDRHFLQVPEGRCPTTSGWHPWFEVAVRGEARGEAGLGPEHGNQAFGPVSEQKLRLEADRLDAILASIERHGYQPRLGGYVQGFFMLAADGDWVFVVWTGFHRVAAMAHLGFEEFQACFNRGMPRFVEAADVSAWPMVRKGELTSAEALRVFGQYFRGSAAGHAADAS